MTDIARIDDTFTDHTILVMAIRYGDHPKLWSYTALKAGGLWYLSGGGKTPQMAQWSAVKRWLSQSGREVVRVELVTRTETIWRPNWKHEDRVCDTCSDTGVVHEEGQPGEQWVRTCPDCCSTSGHRGGNVPCPDCYPVDSDSFRVAEQLHDDLERSSDPTA